MARTQAGNALTEAHRQGQFRIRAAALRDFLQLWPLWGGDERSFARLVEATLPLIRVHHGLSSSLAAGYFDAFRSAEGVPGIAAPRLADVVNIERITSSLYVTGAVMTRKAIAAGNSPQAAMQTALIRTSGAVGRHVLQGGRDTLLASAGADKRAKGWKRITSPGACDFCEMLAAGGGESFEAHDHCGCMAEPSY